MKIRIVEPRPMGFEPHHKGREYECEPITDWLGKQTVAFLLQIKPPRGFAYKSRIGAEHIGKGNAEIVQEYPWLC